MGTNGEFELHPTNGEFLVDDDGRWQICGNCCGCPCNGDDWADLVNGVTEECNGLVACYQLKNYSDGDLANCADCVASGLDAWDGTFQAVAAQGLDGCDWGCFDGPCDLSIDGKRLYKAVLQYTGMSGGRRWGLRVTCYKNPGNFYNVWWGWKATGVTPAGIYTRDVGCDATSTLEVEACP